MKYLVTVQSKDVVEVEAKSAGEAVRKVEQDARDFPSVWYESTVVKVEKGG